MKRITNFLGLLGAVLAFSASSLQAAMPETESAIAQQPGYLKSHFVPEKPATKSSHASTIIESKGQLMAAWFGGTDEGALDVSIWLSRFQNGAWSEAEEVANGVHDDIRVRYPTWNPVLFRGITGPLILFYKEGPSPDSWWGMMKSSTDNGRTWSKAKKLPKNIYGPIRNKPVQLEDGTILCGSSTEDEGWRVHMERTKHPWYSWTRTGALNAAMEYGAIQPTILVHEGNLIQILCRTKQKVITESWSNDNGITWSRMKPTVLPNNNSAIDAVKLADGRSLLVYNHATEGRSVMNVAVSNDGRKWSGALVLENTPGSEFSYPAVIQTADKNVHITYTWNREKIKHVIIDPSKLTPQPMVEGQWPW
ncbi:MAG: sialidase family protein [Verrucomicrobiales bacterium]